MMFIYREHMRDSYSKRKKEKKKIIRYNNMFIKKFIQSVVLVACL